MSGEMERFEPRESRGRLAYEHFHRYAICREFVRDLAVLDIACGAGYGSALLAETASSVKGIDLSESAIERARKTYKHANLEYLVADCYRLPFDDASFDAVVANEMIEHVADHDGLIREAKRVLRPGGLLIISTPNKPVYNRYKTPNAFHISEMDRAEFDGLLDRNFSHHKLLGCRLSLNSVSYPINAQSKNAEPTARVFLGHYDVHGDMHLLAGDVGLSDPEYFLALCSDGDLPAGDLTSFYLAADDDLWLEHEKILAWASQLHEEDELLRQEVRQSRAALNQHEAEVAEIERRLHAEKVDAVNAAGRENALELAGHREREQIVIRLLSRMIGADQVAESASPIESLFIANERIVSLEARLESVQDLNVHLHELTARAGDLTSQRDAESRRASELEAELHSREERLATFARRLETLEQENIGLREKEAHVSDLELQRDAERRRADDFEAAMRSREEALATLSHRLETSEQEIDAVRKRSAQTEATLQADLLQARRGAETQGKRAVQAETERDDALLARQSAERELGIARDAANAERRSAEQVAEKLNFARIHSCVADELDSSTWQVRRFFAGRTNKATLKALGDKSAIWKHWRDPAPASFMPSWLAHQRPELKGDVNWRRYRSDGSLFDLDPHPLFSASYYFSQLPAVDGNIYNPLSHYLSTGWKQGLSPHPLFANDWYLAQNPDVLEADVNPLEHYLTHGWREGRLANPVFDARDYLARYPDVAKEGVDPLVHYLMHGTNEGREMNSKLLDLRSLHLLPAEARGDGLLRFLLTERKVLFPTFENLATEIEQSAVGECWPPEPLDHYWLTQTMRDHLVSRYGEDTIPFYWYLFSVMNRYASRNDFGQSADCSRLFERARLLASQPRRISSGSPRASVIVPVYNNLLDTMLCILSLLELPDLSSFEIIVADDCSSDETPQIIPLIGGCVRHFRQSANKGFLENCNVAATEARGDVLIMLNNDTIVLPGWLDGLLAPFDTSETTGLVGSKLLNADGTLQEAGGIFWRDGSAWNFGRDQDASHPQFNYLKDVDYCSGASLAVPAQLWRDLEGFDPIYRPAYCEDSDLAFRIRARGLRTIYNPSSEVVHHEGRSHGRDVSTGVKAYQVINQETLLKRWQAVLEREHFANGENVLRARDRSFGKPHILVIDHYVPQWDQDAGSRTIYQYIRTLLAMGFAVTFWPDNLYQDPRYTQVLQAMGVEVIYGPLFVGEFDRFLKEREGLYDAAFLSRPHVAIDYVDSLRKHSSARILYYGHDLHFRRMETSHAVDGQGDPAAVSKMREMELSVCERCDVIYYPSEEEVALLRDLLGDGRLCIPNPVFTFDEESIAASRARICAIENNRGNHLLFVGGFAHTPNVDAVLWFAQEVLPRLKRSGVNFSVTVAGSRPPAEVLALNAEGLDVLGFVSDEKLHELYENASVTIAPLRFGAGVKGKVIEAMAWPVPVVTTSIGAQGIGDAGEMLFIADDAEGFANQILRALDDRKGAMERAARGLDFIAEHYSEAALKRMFVRSLPNVFGNG